jgi:hypothetical protein
MGQEPNHATVKKPGPRYIIQYFREGMNPLFVSVSVCRRSSLLTGEGRGAWSRIIRPPESLALYKTFNTLWVHGTGYKKQVGKSDCGSVQFAFAGKFAPHILARSDMAAGCNCNHAHTRSGRAKKLLEINIRAKYVFGKCLANVLPLYLILGEIKIYQIFNSSWKISAKL